MVSKTKPEFERVLCSTARFPMFLLLEGVHVLMYMSLRAGACGVQMIRRNYTGALNSYIKVKLTFYLCT